MPQDHENEYFAEKVRRRDGRKVHKNAPRYLIAQESLIPHTALEYDLLRPKVIDIQGRVPATGLHHRTPICLQSPELALRDTATEFQDIWAFGFVIFEVLTGVRLFEIDTLHRAPAAQVDELMLRFSETLGPLTPALKMEWNNYSKYFDDDCRRNERMPHDRMAYSKDSEGGEGGRGGEEGGEEHGKEGEEVGEEEEEGEEEVEEEVGYGSDAYSNGSSEFGSIDTAKL